MTKTEKQQLKDLIEQNKKIVNKVEKGELWDNVYNTEELRFAFAQGLNFANDAFEKFINQGESRSRKIEIVRKYEKSSNITIKEYVINVCGYKHCGSWTFEQLVDEFGIGYIIYMDIVQQKEKGESF